jgi:FkbM family methyltransferase
MGSDYFSKPSLGRLEDKLMKYLPDRGGIFIEAGAYDGYWQSNTYWLERFRSWTGVLVEPIPEFAAKARDQRPRSTVIQCALVGSAEPGDTVQIRYGGTMSMVLGAWGSDEEERKRAALGLRGRAQVPEILTVPARSLSSVLDEAHIGQIDLLSLDVEGHESSVLEGLDLDRHCPQYLLVEIVDFEQAGNTINRILGDRYVGVEQLSRWDYLYRRL